MKNLRPIYFLACLVLVVSLACSVSFGGNNTPAPQQQQPPTQPPQQQNDNAAPTEEAPTETPEPTSPPEPTATAILKFFTEEFDSALGSAWDILTVTGSDNADPDKVTVETRDGKLVWDFESEYVYYYMFFNTFTYEDVTITVRADNRGRNNNSISLICRYDANVGWYEFNIANNGLYDILYAEVTENGSIAYNTITNGGSNSIKQGKEVNEYSITCKGDQLSLTINGDDVKTLTEKTYGLREGQVGMSVSSFNVLPIQIEMDWFKISEP